MSLNSLLERIIAGRWIAGINAEDAIKRVKKINKYRMGAVLNNLGEAFVEKEEVYESVDEYLNLIDLIKKSGVKADIAVKLTEIGLLLGIGVATRNYETIVKKAKRHGILVWIDMEEPNYVSKTIEIYEKMIASGNTGICIQSYLERSEDDIKRIVKEGGKIRLVKGAYRADRKSGSDNYVKLMEYLFKNAKSFTIGTHDSFLIDLALELNKKYKRDVTYAMLNGIRNGLALELAERGEKVSIYIPYGKLWFAYSYRRLKEATHLNLIIGSLFEKGI